MVDIKIRELYYAALSCLNDSNQIAVKNLKILKKLKRVLLFWQDIFSVLPSTSINVFLWQALVHYFRMVMTSYFESIMLLQSVNSYYLSVVFFYVDSKLCSSMWFK